ncbi:2-hydroxyacid dehydrogenase [Acidisphaera sp. L21]|uniref:2-hydroxyacid dehydrogenase n=1 Tax=Acidisphaera sp. L21 TaxID=1641851 RepID=UPI00131E5147|nr:NAD(P)-dependent oxidoreductase [Acidisphaera sp. L21]
MPQFNVVMTAPRLAEAAVAVLEHAGCTIHYMQAYPSAEAVAEQVRACTADAVLTRQGPVMAIAMDASPKLRVIARHGVGVDDVDLAAAAARGIVVTRAPASNTPAVAEHTIAMVLALAKQLRPIGAALAAGAWREGAPPVRDIAGLRLGIVGNGSIGQAVARLAEAFGMVVTMCRTPGKGGITLAEMLPQIDVLSLHCPYSPATHHMIDAAALAAMPPGSFVVNTARGGLIDEPALLSALDTGHIAGAAFDVFEQEPPPADHPLRSHPGMIVTAHMAGTTPRSLTAMGVMAAECIAAVLSGQPVPPGRTVQP